MHVRRFVLWTLLSLSGSWAQADTDWVTLLWHNDLFVGTDGGGYTNGGYISWYDLSSDNREGFRAPLLTRPFLGWLIEEHGDDFEVSAHTVGQAMVTPKDISKSVPDPNDAPYAGLLFFRSGFVTLSGNRADSLSVTLGMVGPSSGADESQRLIHKMTGSTKPQGWDYQIKDEPVGQVERARVWRWGPAPTEEPHADLLMLGNVSIGNLESAVGGALIARYGTRLERSFGTANQLTGRISNPMAIDGGWNVYLGVGADYVYNQIFVSGSGIRSGQKAELRHDQYATYAGWSYSWDRLSLTCSLVANTNLDKNASARQRFGAVTLAWRL